MPSPVVCVSFVSLLGCLTTFAGPAEVTSAPAEKIAAPGWHKLSLSSTFYAEGGTFADLNRDGHVDVIAGPYWYEGPDFQLKHELYAPKPFDPLKYSDNFFAFIDDFNADQWPDILVIGFPGEDAYWLENPGQRGTGWVKHPVLRPVDNESPTYAMLQPGEGASLICMSGGRLGYARPDRGHPNAPWSFHAVSEQLNFQKFTHGLGCGDVNGDGRVDLLTGTGWWEQPVSLQGDPPWRYHAAAFGQGAQILVTDVNGDGRADVISSLNAHGYGLAWFEQLPPVNGETVFARHDILSTESTQQINGVQFSELHALTLADIDGDGLPDIVTGKRWWSHGPGGEHGADDPPVVYAFLLRRDAGGAVRFEPRLIDHDSGVGTQVVAQDINADGRPDILSVNKRGTAILLSTSQP